MDNQEIKAEITRRLLATGRQGIENTVRYLEESDFFSTGCHTHHRFRGGLARHSLETCQYALKHSHGLPADSIILAALLHDTCSSHTRAAAHIPRHGLRSVRILHELCNLELTPAEHDAILHHMHRNADVMRTNPLARLIFRADKISACGAVRLR